MAILKIVKYGDPVLEKPCIPIYDFPVDPQLISDMFETMYSVKGVGLSAPQIGKGIMLSVINVYGKDHKKGEMVIVNPFLLEPNLESPPVGYEYEEVRDREGCLSIPGFTDVIWRPKKVLVRALDAEGKEHEIAGVELLARALCHEIDHLNGILYISKSACTHRQKILNHIKKLRRIGKWQ